MFEEFMRDKVSLVKRNGEIIENITACVQSKMIHIDDAQIPLEEGDRLLRKLPNGLVESYIVEDRGFHEEFMDFKAHYQAKVRKESSMSQRASAVTYNVINNAPVYGMQVGGQKNTQKVTVNSGQDVGEMILKLIDLLDSSSLPELEKEDAIEALKRVSDLSKKDKTDGVIDRATCRLEKIESVLKTSETVYARAVPLLTAIKEFFYAYS